MCVLRVGEYFLGMPSLTGIILELWLQWKNDYARAATLFKDAKLWERASECYTAISKYTDAAAVLHEGCEYSAFVSYLKR